MIQINLLNNLIKQLIGKLDRIIEQNEKIIQQKDKDAAKDALDRYRLPPVYPETPFPTPYTTPSVPPPWTSPFPLTQNIKCGACGKDSGIPHVLNMVISEPGLACYRCGAIVVRPTTTWCIADTNTSTGAKIWLGDSGDNSPKSSL
jgi:hypothetical protein